MITLAGPYAVAAALLLAGGVPKLRRPDPLRRALRSVRLPGQAWLVRLLAAAEVIVGAAALATPGRWPAVAVALSYAAFTGFVLLARARGGVLASCGCFGRPDTPPTRVHAAVTGLYAGIATAVALAPPSAGAVALLAGTPLGGVPALAFTAAAAWLSYAVLALLPRLTRPARPVTHRPVPSG